MCVHISVGFPPFYTLAVVCVRGGMRMHREEADDEKVNMSIEMKCMVVPYNSYTDLIFNSLTSSLTKLKVVERFSFITITYFNETMIGHLWSGFCW